jgi:glucose-6-phosphate isomerase
VSRFVAGSAKAQITLDVSRALASACGRHGLAAGAWESLKRRTAALHRRLTLERRRRRLAFAEVPYESKRPLRDMERVARTRNHLSSMLVLGIGGSALGTRTIVEAVGPGKKPVHVLDNVDPETAAATLARLNLRKTLVNVVTKSGGTAETLALLLRVMEYARRRKVKIPPEHVVVTTDPQPSELSRIAAGKGWALLTLPQGVGGRFSVLTSVGMFPAHFAGLRAVEFLAGARRMADALWFGKPQKNPALLSALLLHALATKKGKSVLAVMPYADRLLGLARWHAQLWAESLGKERDLRGKLVRAGQTPVVARGATDQHSQLQLYLEGPRDKVVAFLRVEKPARQGRRVPAGREILRPGPPRARLRKFFLLRVPFRKIARRASRRRGPGDGVRARARGLPQLHALDSRPLGAGARGAFLFLRVSDRRRRRALEREPLRPAGRRGRKAPHLRPDGTQGVCAVGGERPWPAFWARSSFFSTPRSFWTPRKRPN